KRDCCFEEEGLKVRKEEDVKTYRFEETQEDIDADVEKQKLMRKMKQSTKLDNRTAGEAVTTASVKDSAAPTTIEEITLAQTLIQIKAAKPKVVTTAATTTTITRPKAKWVVVQEPNMMEADRLMAERLQSKEREELTDEEKGKLFMELMEKRRKHFATLRS
ncbi:hypothetical protein Tco_1495563, partial [Tanacetum coccineum]